MKKLLLLLNFLFLTNIIFSQTYRYTENIFASATVNSDVVYETAPFINLPYHNENSTTENDLLMDIYEPTGDSHNLRAAIIFVHAGGFSLGNRNHDDMVAFCDSFARKGYVTATIDYRKGFYLPSNAAMHSTRAAYRGLQDGRSAVRFLRANASTYGIDPNRIYLAGSSAGAFVALHSIYMTELSEKPTDAGVVNYTNIIFPFLHSGPDLGDYDRGSNLSQSGTPNGIISLWGAIFDLALLSPSDTEPIFMAHGTSDDVVPFNAGSPFGLSVFPDVYGSNLINADLTANGITNKEIYFVTDGEHEFYGTSNGTWENGLGGNMYWDILLPKITNFLWLQHKPNADFSFSDNGTALSIDFTDLTLGSTNWLWDFGDGTTSTLQNPTHVFATEDIYMVKLFVQNDILSWDELTLPVDVLAPLPLAWTTPLLADYKEGQTSLHWSVAEQINNDRFVVEHSRNGIQFSAIEEIKVFTNTLAEMTYSSVHEAPPSGLNYYRIRQVDFDGQQTYSSIAVVDVSAVFSFYPNPVFDGINITFAQAEAQWMDVYNTQGVLLQSRKVTNGEYWDLQDLPCGMYWMRNRAGEGIQKMMKR